MHRARVGRIGDKDPILVIVPEWCNLILDHEKTMEIRSIPCTDKVGKEIWLAMSGTSKVYGRARVKACHGPMSKSQWELFRPLHLVPGKRFYGARTHGWELVDVRRCAPKPIVRKNGAVIFQIGPGR